MGISMSGIKQFLDEERGVALTEAMIALPIITIFAVAILEFGSLFWQRHQLETGVRDTARYWSRCRPANMSCTLEDSLSITPVGCKY